MTIAGLSASSGQIFFAQIKVSMSAAFCIQLRHRNALSMHRNGRQRTVSAISGNGRSLRPPKDAATSCRARPSVAGAVPKPSLRVKSRLSCARTVDRRQLATGQATRLCPATQPSCRQTAPALFSPAGLYPIPPTHARDPARPVFLPQTTSPDSSCASAPGVCVHRIPRLR